MLVLRINRAAASVPPKVLNGSIQATRTWVLHRAAGAETGGRQESLGRRSCQCVEQPGAVALIPRALGRLKTGQRNRTEAAYEAVLELRKHAGEVLWYRFEALKLRLADNCFLTPDFAVMLHDGRLQMHEVKGFWTDDAR
jgi:hypothetical protein